MPTYDINPKPELNYRLRVEHRGAGKACQRAGGRDCDDVCGNPGTGLQS